MNLNDRVSIELTKGEIITLQICIHEGVMRLWDRVDYVQRLCNDPLCLKVTRDDITRRVNEILDVYKKLEEQR